MSFSERPMLSAGKKFGCMLYTFVGTFVVLFCLIGGTLGDCAPEIDGSGCKDSLSNFLLFPGSLLITVFGGLLMLWAFTRSER